MAERGISTVRCVTSPVNADSVAFHQRIGFVIEAEDEDYVHFARDDRGARVRAARRSAAR